ncbi:hypothetical protein JCM3765_001857 [Sporobolomyces pararoseus]
MARSVDDRKPRSSNKNKSPLTLPLTLLVLPTTLITLLVWPLLALGSLIPVVGLISLTSLLSCTVFLYLAIPLTLHLLFSQSRLPRTSDSRSFLPLPKLPHLPLFTPSPLSPIRLTHSFLLLLHEAYQASLISLFFDSISKRILILGGNGSSKILRENIIYLSSPDPRYPSKRLDVYYPASNDFEEEEEQDGEGSERQSLKPVILLLASPTYRSLSSKSFPSSQIALRLRRLGYCVIVPSLTSYPDSTTQGMVYELRAVLKWIEREIEAFGGDKRKVWIMGQGVGASLAMLTVVQSAVVVVREEEVRRRSGREEERRRKEGMIGRDDSEDDEEEDGYIEETAFDPFLAKGERHSRNPSNTAIYEGEEEHYFRSTTYKRPTSITTVPYSDSEGSITSRSISSVREFPSGVNACSVPLASATGFEEEARGREGSEPEDRGETISQFGDLTIKGMILVGGSYDNVKQMKWENQLGLSEVSTLPKVFGSSKQSDAELASPSHLLYAASSLLSSSPTMLSIRFLLVHGGKDRLTPYSQSVLLKNLLIGIGIKSERVRLRLYREETGLGGLSSLMHQTKYSPLILDEIERMIASSDVMDELEKDIEGAKKGKEKRKGKSRGQNRT